MINIDLKLVGIGGLIGFIILLMVLFAGRPAGDVNCACDVECTYPTVTSTYQDGWDYTLCGAGCWIKSIEYEDIAGGGQYIITCACCDCIPESGLGLGVCNYGNWLFDTLGSFFGMCRMPTSS